MSIADGDAEIVALQDEDEVETHRSPSQPLNAEVITAPVNETPKLNGQANNNDLRIVNKNNNNNSAEPKQFITSGSASPISSATNGISPKKVDVAVEKPSPPPLVDETVGKRLSRSSPPDVVGHVRPSPIRASPTVRNHRPDVTPTKSSPILMAGVESSTPDVVPSSTPSSVDSFGVVVDTPPESPIGYRFQPITSAPPVAQVTPFNVNDDSIVSTGSQGDTSGVDRLADLETVEEELTVSMEKGVFGLGMALEGGIDSPMGDLPIAIKRVFVGGAADRCGDLEVGDVILAANSRSLTGMTRPEAWQFLKTLPQGVVVMNIRRKSYKF